MFELISDATTEHEIMQRFAEKKDANKIPAGDGLTRPSYLVYTTDEYGVPHIATDDKGQILRIDFVPDPADIQAQQEDWQKRNGLPRDTALQRWEKLSGNGIVDRAKNCSAFLARLRRMRTGTQDTQRDCARPAAAETEDQGAYIRKTTGGPELCHHCHFAGPANHVDG